MAAITSASARCGAASPRAAPLLPPRSPAARQLLRQPRQAGRQPRRAGGVRVQAKKDVGNVLDGAIDAVRPGFVPRPVVKGALAFFGVSFIFSLVQKLLSLALFFGVVVGGGALYLKSIGKDSSP